MAAFLDPLKLAISCLGTSHLALTPGARAGVGTTHAWDLAGGSGMSIGPRLTFTASMHFEVLDRGASRRDERFKVSTRGYMYAVEDDRGREIIAAHWHPQSRSHYVEPHWHIGAPAISESGVWLTRTHIPSPRISLEHMVRWIFESLEGVRPARADWDDCLRRSEALFDQHKTW